MNDEPRAEELLRAVERFLEQEVVGRLEGVPRFHARVAANVVAMVAREIETQDEHLRGEWDRLTELLGDDPPWPEAREAQVGGLRERNETLSERIRSGDADTEPFRSELLAHLRRTIDDKMVVSRPPRQKG
ncbi:MAG: DUF6285 domain-containing protein [Myxococcales bacterium]|nr:DUF6285 domain-containing protein [Myxococcales bacterium]